MTLLIDGYNVLKPRSDNGLVSERHRATFIEQVAFYAKQSSNKVVIVFDGGDSPFGETFHHNGIIVMYSGYRDSADDILKNLLDKQHVDNALLVSTDREICKYAADLRIATMDAHVFYGYLRDRDDSKIKNNGYQKSSGLQKRPGHHSSAEVDALMELAADMMIPHSDRDIQDVSVRKKERQAKKVSKQEKKLQKIIKKL